MNAAFRNGDLACRCELLFGIAAALPHGLALTPPPDDGSDDTDPKTSHKSQNHGRQKSGYQIIEHNTCSDLLLIGLQSGKFFSDLIQHVEVCRR